MRSGGAASIQRRWVRRGEQPPPVPAGAPPAAPYPLQIYTDGSCVDQGSVPRGEWRAAWIECHFDLPMGYQRVCAQP